MVYGLWADQISGNAYSHWTAWHRLLVSVSVSQIAATIVCYFQVHGRRHINFDWNMIFNLSNQIQYKQELGHVQVNGLFLAACNCSQSTVSLVHCAYFIYCMTILP